MILKDKKLKLVGTLDQGGVFYDCDRYFHKDLAKKLIEKYGLEEDYKAYKEENKALDEVNFTLSLGHILFTGEDLVMDESIEINDLQRDFLEKLIKREDISNKLIKNVKEFLA